MVGLYTKGAAILTTLGGGAQGHIGIVMDGTLYSTLSTTAYTLWVQPTRGSLPTRATLVDRDIMEAQYKKEKVTYDIHNTVEEAIKTQS
eukprot:9270788-Ditylum_brightwellii.AAC.2